MAAHQRIVSLDIGSHSVKLGEFLIPKPGFLTLSRYATAPLGLDPNKEEDRHKVLTATLKQLLVSTGIKPNSKVAFSVGGHAVFMRSVKLPAVDVLQIEQMIAFEAQQIVPFPLNEVVWDFQVFPEKPGTIEKEVIIVAMKNDLLEAENAAVRNGGLDAEVIDVGPLALYNAYRYNYLPTEGCTLLIDFGARSTNLLFIENQRFYARFLPLAGNTVSQTICNEFQEPFHVAEQLKIDRGGVNLGGDYASPDDRDTARLWKIIRNVMNRLHTEINRSIIFYRNQQGGSYPVEILISGGTSQTPYVEHFLAERFGVPVNRFNPFQNVTLAPGLDANSLSPVGSCFGEVVGLALRAAGPCPVEVSLVPPTVALRRQNSQGQPYVYGAMAVLFLVFALIIGNSVWEIYQINQQMGQLSEQTSQLKALASRQKPLEIQYADLRLKYDLAENIFTQRDAWLRLLRDINSKIPTGLWITSLTPSYGDHIQDEAGAQKNHPATPSLAGSGGRHGKGLKSGFKEVDQLVISGLYFHDVPVELVNSFIKSLSDLDWFDIDPDKISESLIEIEKHPAEDSDQLDGTFKLRLKLKPSQRISLRP